MTKLVLLSHQLINAHGTRALISCRRGRSCPNKKASLLALELLIGRGEAMRAAGFESRFAEVLPVGGELLQNARRTPWTLAYPTTFGNTAHKKNYDKISG